jgi:hypothetical protein
VSFFQSYYKKAIFLNLFAKVGFRLKFLGFTVPVLHRNYICFLAKTKRVFCFGQGVVYLSEIQTVEDLKELSAKQAKEILAMNR